ncbi:ABC-type transport auxiliary lipoprotein family protein [Helicobacter pametensis]|uniref:ABC-type transport auxiliary lipoprotein family protein n=1 Tax=Helicobacter pametensis TaxID=95149 RepID=UPI000483CE3B|nr:ABC-type transport auxiliary lipoprotein family protein [Helicobacter pametensis]
MKRLSLLPIALLLTGCFSLKTPLPEVNYYDLDFAIDSKDQSCSKPYRVGIADIRALAVYEDHNIVLKKQNGEVTHAPRLSWVDLPKNLLKKAIIEQFDAQCIGVSIPPFGGVRNDFLLKLELLNFEIAQEKSGDVARVGIFYELSDLKDFKILESGMIVKSEPANDYITSFKRAIQALSDELAQKIKTLQHQ